jgi:Transmembrane amino acid transporter protein
LWPNQGNVVAAIAACPIILFAFSCQVNVCSIFQELPSSSSSAVDAVDAIRTPQPVVRRLQENTQRQQQQQRLMMMSRVTISAVVLCTLLYASISAIVLLDFGPATTAKTPNLLQLYHLHNSISNNHSNSTTDHDGGSDHDDADGNGNDKNSTSLMQVAALAMAVAVVVAFPLNIFPARVTLAGIFCSSSSTTSTSSSSSRRRTRDTIVGSLTTPTANETLTAALLEDYPHGQEEESLSRKQQVLHEETATMTTTTCAATTRRKQNEADQEEEPEPLPPPASHSANDGVHECTVTNVVELSCFNHVALTLLLAGSALGMALVVPNISTVFSILGGTASSFLGFVIPGLLGLKLHEHDVAAAAELRLMRQEREPHQQEEDAHQQPQRRRIYDEQHGSCLPVVLSWLLILFGIVMGILTTGATIRSFTHRDEDIWSQKCQRHKTVNM